MSDPEIQAIRERLEAARDKAGQRLEAGLKGVEAARLYAAAADEALKGLWALAEARWPNPNPTDAERLSVLAVGGYGRGVLAPHSDLDLLFLRPGKTTAQAERMVETVLHGLWDLGFKVGWAVRGLDEALRLARSDMTVRTTLLEARPLLGDADLADRLIARFRKEVARADPRAFIQAKLAERDARHARAGAVRYQVEPNVKDGKGGLRDLNTLFWIARALAPESDMGRAALEGMLTHKEQRLAVQAFDFLWAVRIHLHRIAGRAQEKLTFDYQPEVARRMGWAGRGDEPAVERFMRRYFVIARDVGALTRGLCAKLEAQQAKPAEGLMRLLPLPRAKRTRRLDVEGLVVEGGRLSVSDPGVLAARPELMLRLFAEADRLDLDLHPDAFGAVARSLERVTPQMRRSPEAARAFLDVLAHGRRPYRILSLMNETGLLGRFLPEFGRVVGQTQFNRYHAYTVDEHTLQALGILKDIETGRLKDDHPLSHAVMPLIADREALYLAMLLHDVGKGGTRGQLEDGAIAARRACERLGLAPKRAELVAWLVRHHLVLSDFAQKRDTADPATIEAFAGIVGDLERLRMLLALTAADVRAVGPNVWNGFKGRLMRELYGATERRFRGAPDEGVDILGDEADLIGQARDGGPAVRFGQADAQTAELSLAARDRPGLFADVTRALAQQGADVVHARLATTADGVALQIFRLHDQTGRPFAAEDARLGKVLVRAVERAATGRATQASGERRARARRSVFQVAPVVAFDNPTGGASTVVEAAGRDRPGLLADLARVLSEAGLEVRSAHIESHGERAVDAFYVQTADGGRLTSARAQHALRQALLAALDPPLEAAPARPLARARASAAR